MRYSSSNISVGNPLANILVIIVGSLAIIASLVLGFFAFVVVGSIVLVLAAIVGIRVWWFQRKLAKSGAPSSQGVIEGEYRVVADDHEGE